MAAPTTPEEAVEQALLQPQSVSEGGRSISNRTLKELQDAKDRESPAKSKKHFGMRFTQLVPPGAY